MPYLYRFIRQLIININNLFFDSAIFTACLRIVPAILTAPSKSAEDEIYVDGEWWRLMMLGGCIQLLNNKEYLNKINVFPVPGIFRIRIIWGNKSFYDIRNI